MNELDYSTSWIVEDHVERARAEHGDFKAHEWMRFLRSCGLTWDFDYLPRRCAAVTDDTEVIFRHGLELDEIATAAFEEGGQSMFLAGDIRDWLKCPGGKVMVRKLKRRARGFAMLFPERPYTGEEDY